MNQAEVLCHSSGPWKKHKYFQKIGEGANAVYKYAKKKADDKIQGEAVINGNIQDNPAGNKFWADEQRKGYEEMKAREQYIKDHRGEALEFGHTPAEINKNEKMYAGYAHQFAREAQRYGERATKQEMEGRKKSAFYKAEKVSKAAKSTVAKGEKLLKEFFSSETKKTVKDTFTGKTRTPKQTGDDVVNIKKLAKKN